MSGTGARNAGLDRSMEEVLSEALPDALNQLAQRHESFGQVVQYLEDSYIASQRSGKDKMTIENEAKQYITKGLTNVLKDIEVASLNIDQLLQMQSMAVDSIADDVSLIKSRLQGMKSQQLTASLDEMKVAYAAAPPSSSSSSSAVSGASVRRVEVDYLPSSSGNRARAAESDLEGGAEGADESAASTAGPAEARRRVSIEERLAGLDGVGRSAAAGAK